ncbi:MAG TPA: hydrogenase maturation nickel metallochaperone HypA [Solirubrobacteraceae bacterium]|nr:hydrogenase maturation nickel metallochaperone HypA [Solirubrobacteraceae bacterium]
MHELSIAEAVLAIVGEHAGERRVTRVEVSVGALRQVSPPALSFAFELLSSGTAAEGAELVLREVPARGRCRECGATSRLAGFPFCCQRCGALEPEIVSGEELCVESLDVTDEPVPVEEMT